MQKIIADSSDMQLTFNAKKWWNYSIIHLLFQQKVYRPYFINFFNYFHDNTFLAEILKNIDVFIEKCKLVNDKCQFEKPISYFTNTFDEQIFISGRCDIVDEKNKVIYEIKASKYQECSTFWSNQVLLYKLFLQQLNPKYIDYKCKIINVVSGKMYSCGIMNEPNFENVIQIICRKLLELYDE